MTHTTPRDVRTTARRSEFEDRIRFNWGFHDGRHAVESGRRAMWEGKPHFDAVYEAGYRAGQADPLNESSEPAWKASGLVERAPNLFQVKRGYEMLGYVVALTPHAAVRAWAQQKRGS